MIARWMVLLFCWCFLAPSAAGQGWLATRLWFENLTRGSDNAGALLAEPGDRMAVRFRTETDPFAVMKWSTFQATLILDGLTLISDDDANTWAAQASSAFTPSTWYPIKAFHQPDYGPMHDNAIEPSDSTYPLVADRGLYLLVGATDRTGAQNADRKLFEFTVQPGSVGEELHWSFPGRLTGTGLSTRVIDSLAVSRDPTDNFIRVVPEPSASWGLLAGFLVLRRRRGSRFSVTGLGRRCSAVLIIAGLALCPLVARGADYEARLWFQNLTTGADNPGDLIARPGDQIAIRYLFDFRGNYENKWGTLQATLLLDGLTLMSDDDANTWEQQFLAALTPPAQFPIKLFWQPNYGPMHDYAIDPGEPDRPKIADRGLYALVGASAGAAIYFDKQVFQFTVQPGSEGEVLDWALDGRITERGLTTRMLDYTGATVDVTDNRVVVVPEPSAAVALLGATILFRSFGSRAARRCRSRATRLGGIIDRAQRV